MSAPISCGRFVGAAAVVLAALAAGGVASASDTTEPGTAPGCAEITGALDAVETFGYALATGDVDLAQRMLGILPDIAADAEAAAPDDIAETVETWLAPLPLIIAALENIDVSDPDAFEQAVSAIQTGNSDTARGEVSAWAEFNCGWASSLDTEVVAAPEPPGCEELDAAAAAEAAGIDVDVSDLDGSGDFNVPGFWTKSCSYGNGAMSLSTMSFNAVEDAEQFYADNLDVAAGVVLDTDTGSLPESTLVIETGVAVVSSVPTARHRQARPCRRCRSSCSMQRCPSP